MLSWRVARAGNPNMETMMGRVYGEGLEEEGASGEKSASGWELGVRRNSVRRKALYADRHRQAASSSRSLQPGPSEQRSRRAAWSYLRTGLARSVEQSWPPARAVGPLEKAHCVVPSVNRCGVARGIKRS